MLDRINRERRGREQAMRDQALAGLEASDVSSRRSIAMWREDWHEGVVGLVASRLKERAHRPAFAFAPTGSSGRWRGSGRSIPGVHLRDVLDLVAKRHPGLIERFGGHAMAAGLTVVQARLTEFPAALDAAVTELADPTCFEPALLTDGPLPDDAFGLDAVEQIEAQVWGQGFPEPLFSDEFEVRSQRLLKDRHLKLALGRGDRALSAIWFDRRDPLPARCRLAYRLSRDDWAGGGAVQLLVVAVDE
jgi:single-stranded-DNA-specific exonuclease